MSTLYLKVSNYFLITGVVQGIMMASLTLMLFPGKKLPIAKREDRRIRR